MANYPIYYENTDLEAIKNLTENRPTFLITDSNIPKQHIAFISEALKPNYIYQTPAGEKAKRLVEYEKIIDCMQKHHFTKDTIIIAFGGGVVGDLSGFVASTYNRGIPFIQIPTTLLSMVDSSIGCKVAINTARSKNTIGAFYCPKAVWIHPPFLDTLDEKQRQSGMAEIIKIAAISDEKFFHTLNTPYHKLNIKAIIKHAVMLKDAIVSKDMHEADTRKLLNFGHTIGHALEQYHNYTYTHGHCVAMGMRLMSKAMPWYDTLEAVLSTHKLSTPIPYTKDALTPYLLNDKKATQNTLDIILLKSLGNGYIKTINKNEIYQYL